MLTQEEARRLFDYDPDTGELTNKTTRSSRALAGAKAGKYGVRGELHVGVNKEPYLAHRLIWLWVHGYFPEHDIDHINRNPSDNRLDNLREATRSCNLRNTKQRTDNTSGVTGVSWANRDNRWQAQIVVNKQNHHLGHFTDFTEAVLTRLAAEQCLNWEGCDSSSDSYQYLNSIRGESK